MSSPAMTNAAVREPAVDKLQRVLWNALRRRRIANGLKITGVQRNAYSSSFASLILTCESDDGTPLRIFCKRGGGAAYEAFGHKGGVAYEAGIYRRVLRLSRLPLPRYLTSHTIGDTEVWLFLEQMDQCLRWSNCWDPSAAAVQLADWIGRFHAEQEARLKRGRPRFLLNHDATYYRSWVARAWQHVQPSFQRERWLAALRPKVDHALPWILQTPRTLIHGELFPKNVLVRDGGVFPIDWESASIAAGELDLASLTDNWPADVTAACEERYARCRWPAGAPADFRQTLESARLFHQFRWLGESPDRKGGAARWRLKHLRRAGENLGLI
jgi:hypothetical protein